MATTIADSMAAKTHGVGLISFLLKLAILTDSFVCLQSCFRYHLAKSSFGPGNCFGVKDGNRSQIRLLLFFFLTKDVYFEKAESTDDLRISAQVWFRLRPTLHSLTKKPFHVSTKDTENFFDCCNRPIRTRSSI